MKRTFTRDFLIEELDLPYKAIHQKLVDQGRWTNYYEIVFEYNGKYWKTTYGAGATEFQEEAPWEYQDEVECVEVEKRQVLRMEWCEVEDNEL